MISIFCTSKRIYIFVNDIHKGCKIMLYLHVLIVCAPLGYSVLYYILTGYMHIRFICVKIQYVP